MSLKIRDILYSRYFQVFVVLVLAVFARTSNWRFVFDSMESHLAFYDADSFYHLRRIAHFIQNFPNVMRFDPTADWPTGGRVDWPEGMLLLYGIPAKILGLSTHFSLELFASILTVLLGSLVCVLAYRVSRSFFSERSSLPFWVAVALALNPLAVRYSALGQLDHHLMEILMSLLCVGVLARYSEFQSNARRELLTVGFLLSFGFLFSSSMFIPLGALFLVMWWKDRESGEGLNFFYLGFGLGVGLLLLANVGVVFSGRRLFTILQVSYFHVSFWFLLLGLGTLFSSRVSWQWRLSFGALAFVVALLFWEPILRISSSAYEYVFTRAGALAWVGEASPVFYHFDQFDLSFVWSNFGCLFFLIGLALIPCFQRHLPWNERLLFGFLCLLSVPAIFQKRFTGFLIFIFILACFLGWRLLREYISHRVERLAPLIQFVVVLLLLLPFVYTGMRAPGMDPVSAQNFALLDRTLKDWEVDAREAWLRLGSPNEVKSAAWVPTNWGHAVQYWSGYGVISNSYFHGRAMKEDLNLRTLSELPKLLESLQMKSVSYVLLVDEVPLFLKQLEDSGTSASSYRWSDLSSGETRLDLQNLRADFAWMEVLFPEADALPDRESYGPYEVVNRFLFSEHPNFSRSVSLKIN